jgi:hypothetical protein
MRLVIGAVALAVSITAAAPQYRTLDDRFEPPRYTSLDAWNTRATYIREHILASAGLLPMPKKSDLKPVVSGEIRHDEYIVSKVRFESLPGFYVTGNLYRPLGNGPFPAILSPHGHWTNGRLENSDVTSIPGRAIGLARLGFVVFSHDMIGYADSRQLTHTFGSPREEVWGLSLGGLQLWNSIRALDFLETLPYVRKDGFGATGESGGGTQTFLLAAVDPRVTVAAPVNMISLHMQGGCICENIPNLRVDMNNVEIAATMAPRPMLMVSATGDWTNETLEKEYPAVRSIYTLFNAESRVDAVRMDAPHNYNKDSREAVYVWMSRWMKGAAADTKIVEQPFTVDPAEKLLVFPPGGRLPSEAETAESLTRHWIEAARARAGIHRTMPRDAELESALRHALGFGAEPGTATSRATATSRRVAVVAGVDEAVVRALKAAGFETRMVSIEPSLPAPADQIRHFDTYNRTLAGRRVADIVAALKASPSAVLVASGDAALAGFLATAIVPVRRAILDVDRFDMASDDQFVARVDIPGLRRAGDFTTAAYMTSGDMIVHNAGDRFVVPRVKIVSRRLTPTQIAAAAR